MVVGASACPLTYQEMSGSKSSQLRVPNRHQPPRAYLWGYSGSLDGAGGPRGLSISRRERSVRDNVGALSEEQLDHLARYFNEEVTFSRHIGAKVEEVEPGRSVIYIDVEDVHLNGTGTLHGGVYASLIDNAMGLSVLALVGVRTATIEMNVHFLGAVSEGRITCESQVVHRTRRTATAEAKVHDSEGNLVAMGTGAFRVFERKGNAIV